MKSVMSRWNESWYMKSEISRSILLKRLEICGSESDKTMHGTESNVAFETESRHICMSHGTYDLNVWQANQGDGVGLIGQNGACEWVTSHMQSVMSRMNKPLHIYVAGKSSHGTHMNNLRHTYKWVMSHIWTSHVTHINESCHTYERVLSCV